MAITNEKESESEGMELNTKSDVSMAEEIIKKQRSERWKAYLRKWYQKNRKRQLEKSRVYYQNNKDQIKAKRIKKAMNKEATNENT